MFKSIKYIKHDGAIYYYALIDDCFQTVISVPEGREAWHHNVTYALIKEYETRKLHVIKNLAKYYEFIHNSVKINIHFVLLDHVLQFKQLHSAIQYDKKYAPLLKYCYLRIYYPVVYKY